MYAILRSYRNHTTRDEYSGIVYKDESLSACQKTLETKLHIEESEYYKQCKDDYDMSYEDSQDIIDCSLINNVGKLTIDNDEFIKYEIIKI